MFLLYHRRSAPTGAVLAAALGVDHGTELPMGGGDVLIRWGSRAIAGFGAANAYEQTINRNGALRLASDKLGSLRAMREAGVPVPDFDTDPEALVERVGWPILGRRETHARGTDIVLCLQRRDLRRERHHYVQYLPTVREYRLHVVNGEVIRVQGKFLDHPEQAQPWIRNYATGYRFRSPRRNLNRDRHEAALGAVRALGLDFGAVDLLVADDGNCYVLEVNTAPSCSPLTGRAYVDALAQLAGIYQGQINYDALSALSTDEGDSEDEEE